MRFAYWILRHPVEDISHIDVDKNEPVTSLKSAIKQAAASDLTTTPAISLGLYKILATEENLPSELSRITADSLKDLPRLRATTPLLDYFPDREDNKLYIIIVEPRSKLWWLL
jgi:hypothetical protein